MQETFIVVVVIGITAFSVLATVVAAETLELAQTAETCKERSGAWPIINRFVRRNMIPYLAHAGISPPKVG